ncbi:hypothetical protein DSO57_1018589 [Entomophthora muscae]|uniref:Uncharacterized protein n=1 Tax=Entomophthora muscae TaxID=34485 RepID=A0ACC2UQM6_9FUNG|nr:hypothetical protein DSO57_1018589 [Entomophthora muscae]
MIPKSRREKSSQPRGRDTLVDNSYQSSSIPPSIADSEPADTGALPILLLFHNIFDDSDMDDSDIEDPKTYGYCHDLRHSTESQQEILTLELDLY